MTEAAGMSSPARSASIRRLAAVVSLATSIGMAASSCTSTQLKGEASSYLIIDALEGANGADPEKFGSVVDSDVITLIKTTVNGQDVFVPTIYSDPGRVTFRLAMRDPGSIDNPSSPSTMNFITVNRYHVEYIRADGRNKPGVDVPYPFDSAITVSVGSAGASSGLELVRIQAKAEAPLKGLGGFGVPHTISTIARVTFFGADQAGRETSVTGQIGVTFSDWGDPQ